LLKKNPTGSDHGNLVGGTVENRIADSAAGNCTMIPEVQAQRTFVSSDTGGVARTIALSYSDNYPDDLLLQVISDVQRVLASAGMGTGEVVIMQAPGPRMALIHLMSPSLLAVDSALQRIQSQYYKLVLGGTINESANSTNFSLKVV
jgi:hypothetical protein